MPTSPNHLCSACGKRYDQHHGYAPVCDDDERFEQSGIIDREEGKPIIYGFLNGGSPEWWSVMAIAEDGNVLAGHLCSHEVYFLHDLGFGSSDWKHDKYNEHYPDGWQLVWVDRDDIDGHEGLQAAFTLGRALQQDQEAEAQA